jgi:hypothetical protein
MSKPSEHAESALCFSQDEWQSLIDYGTKFLRFLEASIEEADRLMGGSTQSIWLSEEDPTNYGWVLQPHRDDGLALDFLQEVVDDIGLSNEQRDWRQVWAWHNKDWIQDGEMRHVCGLLPAESLVVWKWSCCECIFEGVLTLSSTRLRNTLPRTR